MFRKDRTGDSGQAMIEFGISALVFFLLIFATLDFGFLFFAKVTLQNAVRQAGRYAITGNCGSGNCFGTSGNRLPVIFQTVADYSFFLNPSVTVACVSGSCPGYAGGGSGGSSGNAGGPGDFVKITATYVWHPFLVSRFFTGGSYNVSVSSTFQNEMFQPPS
jgi:hypothetical protein